MTGAKTSFRLSLFWQRVTVQSAIVTHSCRSYWLLTPLICFPFTYLFVQTFATAQRSDWTTKWFRHTLWGLKLIQFWGPSVCVKKSIKIRYENEYLYMDPPRALNVARASERHWTLSFIGFIVNPSLMPPQHFIGGTEGNHGNMRF